MLIATVTLDGLEFDANAEVDSESDCVNIQLCERGGCNVKEMLTFSREEWDDFKCMVDHAFEVAECDDGDE